MTAASQPSTIDLPDVLHIGCGPDYREGYHNVDVNPGVEPDAVVDLDGEWPWPDSSFTHVRASHVLEHLDVEHAFHELARVLVADGTLDVYYPMGRDFWTDSTHPPENKWTYDTPEFYTADERRPWGPDHPFTIEARDLEMWWPGPLHRGTPLLHWIGERWPRIEEWFGWAGELHVRFRRL